MPDVDLNLGMPSRCIPQGRSYTNIVFEPTCGLLIAASLVQAQFSSYDEEGVETWVPDGKPRLKIYVVLEVLRRPGASNVSYPMSDCSTLELFSSDFVAIDGYGVFSWTIGLLPL
jgi:cleavage and polyadenylation specificity factor subunit 1